MGTGQVLHVDVVPDAGAVRRVVVRAVDAEAVASPEDGADGARDDVLLRPMVLTQGSVGMASGGVEVAQGHGPEPARPRVVGERALEGQLGRAVGVEGICDDPPSSACAPACRTSRTRAEDDEGTAARGHGVEQGHSLPRSRGSTRRIPHRVRDAQQARNGPRRRAPARRSPGRPYRRGPLHQRVPRCTAARWPRRDRPARDVVAGPRSARGRRGYRCSPRLRSRGPSPTADPLVVEPHLAQQRRVVDVCPSKIAAAASGLDASKSGSRTRSTPWRGPGVGAFDGIVAAGAQVPPARGRPPAAGMAFGSYRAPSLRPRAGLDDAQAGASRMSSGAA